MERATEFSIDEFYHAFNRGVEKRDIFLDQKDYFRFLTLLFLCNSKAAVNVRDQFPKGLPFGKFGEVVRFADKQKEGLVAIGAYCLMPNHFHILVKEIAENGISVFFAKLLTSYSMYFNKKYGRTGRLFENTFKAQHADSDEYLKYLFSYIHLNPIKLIEPKWKEKGIINLARARSHLAGYRHSSYPDYTGAPRPESIILNRAAFPEYFETQTDLKAHINDWLNFPEGSPL